MDAIEILTSCVGVTTVSNVSSTTKVIILALLLIYITINVPLILFDP
jgi:hypothetical protein